MRVFAAALVALAVATPAGAALQPGDRASIDVAVATLWKAPNLYRSIDRPSLANPVDLDAWNRNLSSTESRVWLDSHVQTQALYAQQVVVLARRGGWAQVAVVDEPDPQNAYGYPGWLPVSQLGRLVNPAGRQVVVVSRTARLRFPSGSSLAVSYGTKLNLVGDSAGDAIVDTPGSPHATLPHGTFVRVLKPSAASIVRQAERFVGLRYLWGGLSDWGFDCSGLVWDVFRVHGMTIPRDADPQFRHGTPVARNALRPGDLVFYGTQRYVHHVAIYAGNGLMVEAPDSAHSVRVVPLRDSGYAGARRYVSG